MGCAPYVVSKTGFIKRNKAWGTSDFADYYDILLVPAQPGKPWDKAAVEHVVQLVYTRVLGYFDGPARFLAFLQPLEGVVTFVSCFLLLPW